MKKQLNPGLQWSMYFIDQKGNKVYDRNNINQIITDYYADLYNDIDKINTVNTSEIKKEIEPPFLEKEIEAIVKQLKPNKCPGHDKITNEHIKMGGVELIKKLTKLFNKVLETSKIPKDWKVSDIIILFKKGDRHKVENYRPITLTSTIAKKISKAIETRVRKILNSQQPIE